MALKVTQNDIENRKYYVLQKMGKKYAPNAKLKQLYDALNQAVDGNVNFALDPKTINGYLNILDSHGLLSEQMHKEISENKDSNSLSQTIKNDGALFVKDYNKIISNNGKPVSLLSYINLRDNVHEYLQKASVSNLAVSRDLDLEEDINAGKTTPKMVTTLSAVPDANERVYSKTYGSEIVATPYLNNLSLNDFLYTQSGEKVSRSQAYKARNAALGERSKKINSEEYQNKLVANFNDIAVVDGDDKQLKGFNQVKTVLGDYLSDTDLKSISHSIDPDLQYTPLQMKRSQELLKHLYDSGTDFDITASESQPGSLNAFFSVGSGTRASVRILDTDTDYIGRIYNNGSAYYVSTASNHYRTDSDNTTIYESTTAPLDYMLNQKEGRIQFSSEQRKSHSIYVNDSGDETPASIKMTYQNYLGASEYEVYNFENRQDAVKQVKSMVFVARRQFLQQLVGPDLTNIDNNIAGYQSELKSYIKDNDLSENAVNAGFDFVKSLGLQSNLMTFDPTGQKGKELVSQYNLSGDDVSGIQKMMTAMRSYADSDVGTLQDGFRPVRVADLNNVSVKHDSSELLTAALNRSRYDKSLLKTDEQSTRFMEGLIEYSDASSHSLEDEPDEFKRKMMQTVRDSLYDASVIGYNPTEKSKKDAEVSSDAKNAETKAEDQDEEDSQPKVSIDDNGIIHWEGYRLKYTSRTKGKSAEYMKVSGDIGQIFSPDEQGVLHIKFNSDEAFDFVPGISGYYEFGGDDNRSRMERLRGQGYEQIMKLQLTNAVNQQLLRPTSEYKTLSLPSDSTILNKAYHGETYGTRLPTDWVSDTSLGADAISPEIKENVIKTLNKRVHFPNKLRDNATSFSEDAKDPSGLSALVDHKNLRQLDNDYIGTFDMTMTGTNKSQGMVLYLTEGSKLNDDGTFKKVSMDEIVKDPKLAKAPVRNLSEFAYQKFNAWDRNQMASNQILTANRVDKAGTALATMGGWTFDDSAVISKDFAEKNQVLDHEGNLRPLTKGDKLSDYGGNKATIGLIVDRNMSASEAKSQGLSKEVAIFQQNPDLDVVMSPYSVVTRDNTGVVHELMNNNPRQASYVDPEDGMKKDFAQYGDLNLIVTDMLADQKTHAYSKEDIADGKGRKLSSQYVWALNQHGADKIVQNAFNANERAWGAYREYLMTTGFDLSKDGKIQIGYHPHDNELRNEFNAPSGKIFSMAEREEEVTKFMNHLGTESGMLNLPIEVELASGVKTKQLPIMSSHLRSNTEFEDGSRKLNKYTTRYSNIYNEVLSYNSAEASAKLLDDPNELTKSGKPRDKRQQVAKKLQAAVSGLQNEIVNSQLGGYNGENVKHSFVRDKLMSHKMPDSATAVATADPRLSINEVGISPEVAKSLKVKDGDYALVNRDPALHAGSVRAMHVKIDESLTGISLSPTADKSFDGDFDGDTYGLVTQPEFKTDPEIRKELEKMENKNNLLDPGAPTPESYVNVSMDAVSGSVSGNITTQPDESDVDAPNPKQQLSAMFTSIAVNSKDSDEALQKTDDLLRKTVNQNNYGAAKVDLMSREDMLESVTDMTRSGAKGSASKVEEYMKYFDGMKGSEKRAHDQEIQRAAGYKSDLTGVAGSYSQRLIALGRDINPEAALEVTYKASQGTLQVKHDAEQGEIVKDVLNNKLNNLFNGKHAMGNDSSKLYKQDFVNEFSDVYTNELGVDVSTKHLEQIADMLSDGRGEIQPVSSLVEAKGSPLDRLAYVGGIDTLTKLAQEGRSVLEGSKSSLIVPESMKSESGKDKLVKHDAQNNELLSSLRDSLNAELSNVQTSGKVDLGSEKINNFVDESTEVEDDKEKISKHDTSYGFEP